MVKKTESSKRCFGEIAESGPSLQSTCCLFFDAKSTEYQLNLPVLPSELHLALRLEHNIASENVSVHLFLIGSAVVLDISGHSFAVDEPVTSLLSSCRHVITAGKCACGQMSNNCEELMLHLLTEINDTQIITAAKFQEMLQQFQIYLNKPKQSADQQPKSVSTQSVNESASTTQMTRTRDDSIKTPKTRLYVAPRSRERK